MAVEGGTVAGLFALQVLVEDADDFFGHLWVLDAAVGGRHNFFAQGGFHAGAGVWDDAV